MRRNKKINVDGFMPNRSPKGHALGVYVLQGIDGKWRDGEGHQTGDSFTLWDTAEEAAEEARWIWDCKGDFPCT